MRGNYYRKSGTYFCFNCSTHLAGLNIISKLGQIDYNEVKKDYLQKFIKIQNDCYSSEISPLTASSFEEKPKVNTTFDIPDNWIDIPEQELKQHVLDRKVLEAKGSPDNWRLYYNEQTDRICIPWIKNQQITYYQERAIRPWQPNKYLFPKDSSKDIFGLDKIDDSWKYILFTEGCFDSVFLPNGIAIGGIYPNVDQMSLLENIKFDMELVWFPDNFWVDQSSKDKILRQCEKNPLQKIFVWDKSITSKDINEVVLHINDIDFFFDNKQYIESRITTLNKLKIMLKFDSDIL